MFKKITTVLLCMLFAAQVCAVGASAAGEKDYVISNPYAEVDWDSWKAYKTQLHSHTNASDAYPTIHEYVQEHYDLDYDIVALTDHGTINRGWNKAPQTVPLMRLVKYERTHMDDIIPLTEAEYQSYLNGTAASSRRTHKNGMLDVPKGIELNMATPISDCHLTGYFADYGQGLAGVYGDYETPAREVKKQGGLTMLSHVGEYLYPIGFEDSAEHAGKLNDEYYANKFARIFMENPGSCVGMGINSANDEFTRCDRILYDQILQKTIPNGVTPWAFCFSDSHKIEVMDISYTMMYMKDLSIDEFRRSMERGEFFSVSRYSNGIELNGMKEWPEFDNDKVETYLKNPMPMITRVTVDQKNDKISIEGEVTIYNEASTPQFSEDAVVTVESTGNAWTYNPTVCDASAMDQLLSVDPVCTEIQFTGTLSIDGNYVNVAIDGASKAIGSVKYIDNTTISDLDGAVVVVKGYFVGTSSGKYVNVLPYSIEAAGEVPPSITVNPTSLTFAAAGEAKTVAVTKKNADDCTIEASADNEQFTVEVSGDQVNVTTKENTAEEAISGTLTVKLMKAGEAVATATVALKQNGVSQGGETKTFTSMDIFTCTEDDSAAKAYTLGNQSTFNGEAASGVKLGTSSAAGYFTSQAVGVTGAKKLSFYAVAWKGKSATIYVRVNNGGSVSTASVDLAANDGATGIPPFTITVTDSDYYTFDLTDLTEASTVTISTSADFDTASSSAPRAVIAGIQLY